MVVKIKQRVPDKDTLERHDYIKHDVKQVETYKSLDGNYMFAIKFEDGRSQHFNLSFFDFECE